MADVDMERRRSRRVIAAGMVSALFTAAVFGAVVWLHAVDPASPAIPAIIGAAIAVTVVVAFGAAALMILMLVRNRPELRPARFIVTDSGFLVPPLIDPRRMAIPFLLLTGPMLSLEWVSVIGDGLAGVVLLAVPTVSFVGLAAFLWFVGPRPFMTLTASGLRWDARVFRRDIPWEALAPGGPPRPGPAAQRLILATLRPDLVSQAGVNLGAGTPQAPVVGLQLRVHPAFLADAIRWYAEHPEHRADIGTQIELERLLAAVTGSGS